MLNNIDKGNHLSWNLKPWRKSTYSQKHYHMAMWELLFLVYIFLLLSVPYAIVWKTGTILCLYGTSYLRIINVTKQDGCLFLWKSILYFILCGFFLILARKCILIYVLQEYNLFHFTSILCCVFVSGLSLLDLSVWMHDSFDHLKAMFIFLSKE